MLTPEFLREILDYEPETGILRWKARPREHFKNNGSFLRWNRQKPGKETGTLDPDGYLRVGIRSYPHLAHRLIWLMLYGELPVAIDHRDLNPSNNRLSNLRACSDAQNQHNRGINKNNKSGFKGVSFHKQTGRWRAYIVVNYKQKSLGIHDTPEEAHKAFCKAADELHGKFANHGL